ncbi:MAG: hypothetical protein ABH877_02720 [bacterium]
MLFATRELVQLYSKWESIEVPANGQAVAMDWLLDDCKMVVIRRISVGPWDATRDRGAAVWYSACINAVETACGPWQYSWSMGGVGGGPLMMPSPIPQVMVTGHRLIINLDNKDPEPHLFRVVVECDRYFEETWRDRVRSWWRRFWWRLRHWRN